MSSTTHTPALRARLADLFEQVGPSAPTLNEGWDASMLAAHLVLRDRRPDAALGVVLPVLRAHTERVQREYAAKPWPELIGLLRDGPPRWSPVAVPAVAEVANLVEYYAHTEDLRRAQVPMPPPRLDPAVDDALWGRLPVVARLVLRAARARITLRRDTGGEVVTGRGGAEVTVTGAAPELLLHVLGRDVARPGIVDVAVIGTPAALEAYTKVKRRL